MIITIDRRREKVKQRVSPSLFELLVESHFSNKIRNILEAWFVEYPQEDKKRLKGEFYSKETNQHLGALLELFMCRLFKSLKYELIKNEGKKIPDFLLAKNGRKLFVECTTSGSFIDENQMIKDYRLIEYILSSIESPFLL